MMLPKLGRTWYCIYADSQCAIVATSPDEQVTYSKVNYLSVPLQPFKQRFEQWMTILIVVFWTQYVIISYIYISSWCVFFSLFHVVQGTCAQLRQKKPLLFSIGYLLLGSLGLNQQIYHLLVTFTVRHGLSMALIEIDGLPMFTYE